MDSMYVREQWWITLNKISIKIFLHYRQIRDLEAMHEELSKTKSELRQTREELVHNTAQKEKISSQVFTEKRFPFGAQLRFTSIFF